MGQRLVITIQKGESVLAKGYYHWSAYTNSALETLLDVLSGYDDAVKEIQNINEKDRDVILAVRMLEASSAGICREDEEYAKDKYPNVQFKECIDRNFGLIALSKKEMDSFDGWSEGDIFVDLETKKVDFEVLFETCDENIIESLDLDEDSEIEEELEKYKNSLPVLEFAHSFSEIPFDAIYELSNKMQEIENIAYDFKKDGIIYSIIC